MIATDVVLEIDQIETTLDGIGLPWARRENGWAVTPPDGSRELWVQQREAGVTVDAVLVEWDEAGPESLEALKQYLEEAQKGIRGLRCRIDGTQARLIVDVKDDIENALPDAILAVSAGCRFLAREARALLDPTLARCWLAFSRNDDERR